MLRFLSIIGFATLLASAAAAQAETPTKKLETAKEAPTQGEPSAKKTPPYKGAAVVLVDVRYILTHYTPLRTQLEDWRKEYDSAQLRHQDELKVIAQLKQHMNEMVVDSPDYRKLEEAIVQRQIGAAASWKTDERRYLRQRAKLFADVYQLIRADVNEFMKEHGIALVLNFDGDPFPGTPLTIAQLSRELGGYGGFRISCDSGWDCILTAVTSEVDPKTDADEPQPRTSPQRMEHGLRGNMLSVHRDHDVTPLILLRLSKKPAAKVKEAAKDLTATVPKQDHPKNPEVK